jgi:transposase InsO family protein/transposase
MMQQIYHSNAKTNISNRQFIQKNTESNSQLASRFSISKQTVSKWKNRDFTVDAPSKPLTIAYALTDLERSLAISLRTSAWASLDEVWESLLAINQKITRTSIYRCFVQAGINKIPQEKREKAKQFKEYAPGYLHIDVTYLPKFEGQANYLFVAIDRCTRTMIYKIYAEKTAQNTEDFMEVCLDFFPFEISHILTDNGLEFTNQLIKSKKGELCQKPSKMDIKCAQHQIEHRLTAPATPKTNGMVERVNGTIKNETILKTQYLSQNEMKTDLTKFLIYYNIYRRHGSLRKELKVKTPLEAMEKWYQFKPEIFKKTPEEFKNIILNLQ